MIRWLKVYGITEDKSINTLGKWDCPLIKLESVRVNLIDSKGRSYDISFNEGEETIKIDINGTQKIELNNKTIDL